MYGSMTPTSAEPGATASATGTPRRHSSSTIGRAGEPSASRSAADDEPSRAAPATSAAITAKGLASHALRRRSAATASEFAASQAR